MANPLAQAIDDLKEAHLAGGPVAVEEIAADYGVNPVLLARKFAESYPNGVARLTSAQDALAAKIEKNVERVAKLYGVDPQRAKEMEIRGVRYKVLCRDARARVRPYVAIRLTDGQAVRLEA